MDDDSEALSHVAFLARSATRVRVLELLSNEGPTTRRELRERIDASRSTLTRTLSAMEERSWIGPNGHEYRLTPAGTVVADGFLDLIERIEATEELSEFLRWFPIEEFDLDPTDLAPAEVTVSRDGNPYAPSRRQTEALTETEEFRSLLPIIDRDGAAVARDRMVNGDLDAEVTVSPAVVETITDEEFAELFDEPLGTDRLTVYAADRELPFYLALLDEGRVHLGVDDDDGFPRALLETDDPAVREWAERTYRRYRDAADEMGPDAFD